MAVIANSRVYVPAPSPIVPRYGLFTVATGPLALPVHARTSGLEYQMSTCSLPYGYATTCVQDSLATKSFDTGEPSLIAGDPFVVIASLNCGSVGMPESLYATVLMDQLRANEQPAVENIFSQGLVGQSPSLSNNSPNLTQLTAVSNMAAAFGALENFYYTTSGLGTPATIHVPAIAASEVLSNILVWKDGGIWKTGMGTLVSFGNYAGKAANGTSPAAGHTTLYITGQTTVWRTPDSDVFMTPYEGALNRSTNQINAFIEREYIVTYDCFAAAVDVTL